MRARIPSSTLTPPRLTVSRAAGEDYRRGEEADGDDEPDETLAIAGTDTADESNMEEGRDVVAVPPTLAALEAAELSSTGGSAHGQAGCLSSQEDAPSLPVRSLLTSPLRKKQEAAEAERQEIVREKLRKLRARAKKVRQRIAATASGLRLEQLESVWQGGASTQGSKRMLRLLADLAQLTNQPQSDGAETTAWELCRLLEAGRERDLHTVRTTSPDISPGDPSTIPRSP